MICLINDWPGFKEKKWINAFPNIIHIINKIPPQQKKKKNSQKFMNFKSVEQSPLLIYSFSLPILLVDVQSPMQSCRSLPS